MKTKRFFMPLLILVALAVTMSFASCSSSDDSPSTPETQTYTLSYSGGASTSDILQSERLMIVNSIKTYLGLSKSTSVPLYFEMQGSASTNDAKVKTACDKVIADYANYAFKSTSLSLKVRNGTTELMNHQFK